MVVSIPPLLGISHPNQDPHTVKQEQGEYLSFCVKTDGFHNIWRKKEKTEIMAKVLV